MFKHEKQEKELLLKLNLQFFAEGEGEGEKEGGDGEGEKEIEGDVKKDVMIPKARFDEVNEGFKTLKAELDALKADKENAEKELTKKQREEAEKKGEFETLYNSTKQEADTHKAEVKAVKSRVEELEGVVNGLLETKLTTIDKEFHDLIPSSMTPEQKLAWVNAAEAKGLFGSTKQSNTPMGQQSNPKTADKEVGELSPLEMMMAGYNK